MKLTQFLKQYDTEQKSIEFFRTHRENQGISCLKCGSTSLRWISTIRSWTCNKCSYRLGLRKGTVMENSKLAYRIWLTGLYLMVLLPFVVYFVALSGAFSSTGQAVWAAVFAIAVLASAELVWQLILWKKPHHRKGTIFR